MPDVKQNIVFDMEVKGTNKAAAGIKKVDKAAAGAGKAAGKAGAAFKSMLGPIGLVVAAVVAVALVMDKLNDAGNKLARQFKSLNTDMSRFNEQTAGLIDTNAGLVAAIELQEAGLKATRKEMGAIGAAAVSLNQKLGGDADGATTIFNELVDSVKTAKVKGLQEFGVELAKTGTKAEKSKDAMRQLVEKYGDLELAAETAKEKIFAFQNSFDTVVAIEFNNKMTEAEETTRSLFEGLGNLSDAMMQWEADLVATNGELAQHYTFMTDLDVVQLAHNETVQTSLERGEDLLILEGRLIMANEGVSRSLLEEAKAYHELNQRMQETIHAENVLSEIAAQKKADKVQGKGADKLSNLMKEMQRAGTTSEVNAFYKKASALLSTLDNSPFTQFDLAEMSARATTRTLREEKFISTLGKGPSKAVIDKPDFVDFGGGDASKFDLISTIGDTKDSFASLSSTEGLLSSIGDLRDPSKSFGGAGAAAGAASTAASAAGARADQKAIDDAARIESERSTLNTMLGLEQQYMQDSIRMSEQTNRQRAESVENMTASVSSSLSNLSQATDANSRKGFNAMKAMSYAANAIDTISGSTAAFRSVMQTVPFPLNTVLAPLAAGSVAAMGAANGRKIRSQKFGGGAGTPSTSSTSFPSGGSLTGAGAGSQPDNYVINVNVDGNTIHKSMMDANDFADQSGEKHFSTKE